MLQAMQSIMGSPFAGAFEVPKMFLYIMKTMGAKNVQDFLKPDALNISSRIAENAAVQEQADKGNLVPLDQFGG